MRDLTTILETLAFGWVLLGFAAPILVPAISGMFASSAPRAPVSPARWTARAPTR